MSTMQRLSIIKFIPLLMFAVLAITGCTNKNEQSAQKGETQKTLVRYATSAGNLPITFGIKKGYFAEQGLDVKIVTITGGVEAVTAAAAGEADLGGMGSPILVGAAAGVPITIIGAPPASGQASPPPGAGRPPSRSARPASSPRTGGNPSRPPK